MINQSNYEAFALDYLEGNLSNDMRQAMDAFLKDNPLIKEELVMLQDVITLVPDDSIIFENKSGLMREQEGARVVVMKRRFWYRAGAAAAAVAAVYRLWERDGSGTGDASDLETEFDVSLTQFQDYAANLAETWKQEALI